MNKDEIKGKSLEVSILNRGIEGDKLCYKVYNDLLGEIVIGNCDLNANPQYIPGAEHCINGSCLLFLDDGECNFFATLTINSDDSTGGVILLRC